MLARSTKIVESHNLRSIFTLYDIINFEQLRIADYTHWELCLHNPHYYLGSVYLWAKRDGDIDFLEPTDEERVECFDVATNVKRATIDRYQVNRFNYANFQNKDQPLACAYTAQIPLPEDGQRF